MTPQTQHPLAWGGGRGGGGGGGRTPPHPPPPTPHPPPPPPHLQQPRHPCHGVSVAHHVPQPVAAGHQEGVPGAQRHRAHIRLALHVAPGLLEVQVTQRSVWGCGGVWVCGGDHGRAA
jgi:hypothetical protein